MVDGLTFVQALAIGSGTSVAVFGAITAAYCCYMKLRGPITDAVEVQNLPVINLDADIEKGLVSKSVEVQPKNENNKMLTFAFDCGRAFKDIKDDSFVSKKLIGCKI